MRDTTVTCGPMSFAMVAVVFIVLKLTDVIDWSWWLVLSPLWVPWLVAFVTFLPIVIAGMSKK